MTKYRIERIIFGSGRIIYRVQEARYWYPGVYPGFESIPTYHTIYTTMSESSARLFRDTKIQQDKDNLVVSCTEIL